MRRIATLVLTALVAVPVGVALAPAAEAGCLDDPPIPDIRIRKPGKVFQGDGVAGCASTTPTALRKVGKTARFEIRVRNTEESPKAIRVYDDGGSASNEHFKIRFFLNGRNITQKIRGTVEGKTFHNIAPGASTPLLTLTMKVKSGADISDDGYLTVGSRYPSNKFNQENVNAEVDIVS